MPLLMLLRLAWLYLNGGDNMSMRDILHAILKELKGLRRDLKK
jgi:hypothetical protein